MKKIYQAPTEKVHIIRLAKLICESPSQGISTQDIQEEDDVVFEAKDNNGWGDVW